MSTKDPSSSASLLHLAGSKLRNQLGGQLNESASAGVTSKFARAQLEKLGWKEGEGLGKRRQGMSSHIRVKKRAEGVGLGESNVDPAIRQSIGNEWWKDSVGDTLAKLGSGKKKKSKKKSKDSESKKRIFTDQELFEATGGARFGMRAQTQQHGKWKRAESNISEQEENEAKKKVEWDGKSAPVVVLKKTKKAEESSSIKMKKKSKKRKLSEPSMAEKEEKEGSHTISDTNDDTKDNKETEKKSKKRKKEKKAKKSKEEKGECSDEPKQRQKKKRRKKNEG